MVSPSAGAPHVDVPNSRRFIGTRRLLPSFNVTSAAPAPDCSWAGAVDAADATPPLGGVVAAGGAAAAIVGVAAPDTELDSRTATRVASREFSVLNVAIVAAESRAGPGTRLTSNVPPQ